jgi:hypothetical protein
MEKELAWFGTVFFILFGFIGNYELIYPQNSSKPFLA